MSNEKRPHKGGHGKPGHSGKPGNGKFNQGSGQGEGGAKRKRRRRSGAGNGSGSGVSEQNLQRSQNSQRAQNQQSQGRPQKWDDSSRNESRTGRRFDGLTSVERAARRAKTEHDDTKRGGGGTSQRNKSGHERNRRSMSAREFSAAAPSARSRTADTARATVFDVLRSVAESDAYANLVLPKAIRSHRLDHRDAGFATELTYGTLRHQGTYDAILRHCVDRPLEKVGTTTLIVLRMGVHQLLNMRVPAHAALNQSVSLAREKIGAGPASFINAVLRRVSERTPEEWYELIIEDAKDDTERMALLASHPAWIVRSMRQALVAHGRPASEIEQLLEADNLAPVVNLVALPGLGSLEEAREQGAVDGELVEGSALYASGDLARLESVREGTVRAQDAG
ncbi:MAG: 16S rRNA methyltransferase, partial [Rothia mucilaginosa]|nr:16S rRNA methyltransferase [Rothia mucilaginosa]